MRAAAAALLWAGWWVAPAPAQEAAPAETFQAEKFKDWELFCPQPKPKDQPRVCEVRTIITGKEGARLGALAIALNPEPGGADLPLVATALLPLGVDLTRQPALRVGEGAPLPLQFRRCLQRGCEAVATVEAAQIAALRAGTIAKVAVGIGGGKTAVFEFSLAGFTAAHDSMMRRIGRS